MKVRRKKLDIIFSQLVRERANYCCEKCGGNFRDGGLDCCHIMGRRSVALRWHPANAIAMCRADHMWFTEHPFDFRDFCVDHYGEDRVSELRLVSSQPVKWSPKVRDEVYVHYKGELKKMESERVGNGFIIDFEPHEIMHRFGKVETTHIFGR